MLKLLKERVVGLLHHPALPRMQKYFNEGHHATHTIYFLLACLEGHGSYAIVAGVLFAFSVVAPLFNEISEA